MSKQRTIIERLLSGDEYDLTRIDDEIDAWHDADTDLTLNEWLGLTHDEYALYVEQPSCIRTILAARHQEVPVQELLQASNGFALLAARGASPSEVEELRKWLQATGRI
jgi:hypothetical protein